MWLLYNDDHVLAKGIIQGLKTLDTLWLSKTSILT